MRRVPATTTVGVAGPAAGARALRSGTVGTPVKLTLGTKVRFFNVGTANLVIHSGGVISHQGQAPNGLADPVTEPNTAYEQMPTGTGAATWYCHAPATDLGAQDPRFTVQ